ncbi:MAG TPA: hypothetical protein PLV25_03110 [Opitutales bacterium]|nr:hypothetical protein [Opitutales bacterium]
MDSFRPVISTASTRSVAPTSVAAGGGGAVPGSGFGHASIEHGSLGAHTDSQQLVVDQAAIEMEMNALLAMIEQAHAKGPSSDSAGEVDSSEPSSDEDDWEFVAGSGAQPSSNTTSAAAREVGRSELAASHSSDDDDDDWAVVPESVAQPRVPTQLDEVDRSGFEDFVMLDDSGSPTVSGGASGVGGNKSLSVAGLSHMAERVHQVLAPRVPISTTSALAQRLYGEASHVSAEPPQALQYPMILKAGVEARVFQKQDQALLAHLGIQGGSIAETGPLYPSGRPSLLDIQQGHGRHDCFLLSAIAAVMTRKDADGAQDIMNIIHDNGDGTATVTFPECKVTVDTTRLVDGKGHDVYSTGAPWVRILEKAFHARLIGMAEENGELPQSVNLDRQNGMAGLEVLAHLLAPGCLHSATVHKPIQLSDPKNSGYAPQITGALRNGGAVTLGSSPSGGSGFGAKIGAVFTGVKRVFQGIMPGHQYAVVGQTTHNGQPALLVLNPYGTDLPRGLDGQDLKAGDSLDLHGMGKGSGLFAVPLADLHKFFSEAVIMVPPTS